jgi:hypothetical protein
MKQILMIDVSPRGKDSANPAGERNDVANSTPRHGARSPAVIELP